MSTKLALALGVGIAFPALAALGFVAGAENDPAALMWLAVIYAGAPTVLKLCAITIIWNHPMSARRHGIIRRRLDARDRQAQPGIR